MRRFALLMVVAACGPDAIDLPGGSGGIGFDDLRYSPRLHRVLAPGGRSGNLDLIDPDTGDVTAISGFSTSTEFSASAHDFGMTSVDDTGSLLVVTDRTSRRLALVDTDAAIISGDIPLTGSPDYVRWVAATSELWVTEPGAERIEVFSLAGTTLEHSGTISVPGGPESLVIDQDGGRAFTHLWDGATVAIDTTTRAVGDYWTNGCADSRGIAFDAEHGFVFAGCAEGRATVLDARDGRIVDEIWANSGVDVIDWSPSRRHLYLAGQLSGNLAIVGVASSGELGLLGIEDATVYGHCVTTDDAGRAFVCDPRHGRLLEIDDSFKRVTR